MNSTENGTRSIGKWSEGRMNRAHGGGGSAGQGRYGIICEWWTKVANGCKS